MDDQLKELMEGFTQSTKLLNALGDENRQYLILQMMKIDDCTGVRVIEIAKQSHLSRPAVSHHLQILKDAGLIKTRKEGTKVYYYFDPDMKTMHTLMHTLQLAMEITKSLPDRSGE